MKRRVGPWVAVVALLLAGCTSGSPAGSADASPLAHADDSTDGPEERTTDAASDEDRRAAAGSPDGEADDRSAAGSNRPSDRSTEPPSASPSPTPTFADAAVILRDDDGFDEATVSAIEQLDGVAQVGGSRNDEVSLWSSTAADGRIVDSFADGFRVLVTAAVDTADLPGPRLARGEVLLTAQGAALRDGVVVGGEVVLGPDRTTLTVAVIADDPDPYGRAELIVHPDDGDALGLEPLDRVFLLFDAGADVEAVAQELRSLLGTDEPRAVEVRDLGPSGPGRLTLSNIEAKRQFGEFAFRDIAGSRDIDQERAWIDANIVTRQVPLYGSIRCHRAIFDDLRAALTAIVDAGLSDWADPSRFGGCWYPRRIGEGDSLSKHAWGIAVDVNVDFSVPGGGEVPPDQVIEAFRRNGFSWGGDFPTPDNHHFEWVGQD